MIPAAFEYQRAASVEDALGLLAEHGSEAKLLAGGHSLLPLMKLRLARPSRLIDIGRLDELRGVRELPGGGLSVGALATYASLLDDTRLARYAVIADALPQIGDVQVRNRGTIGGSIAHADPASDMPAVLLALDAEVVARSAARGERVIPIAELFQGPFQTSLAEDELLTEIRLPGASGRVGSAYQALRQQASGYSIAGLAAVMGSPGADGSDNAGSGSGALELVRIAVTGVGDHPYRALASEAALAGSSGDDAAIAAAVAAVTQGQTVSGDIHADPTYRAAMAGIMAQRAIKLARARLG